MIFNKIRKSWLSKVVAGQLTVVLTFWSIIPQQSFALTGGPSQPEASSFKPIEASNMVNLFTGDFQYNIPLLSVDGYPINLGYNSTITTDQEASWVGLGWSLNPGSINRTMRGIPDEFAGENIVTTNSMKPNTTYGVDVGFGAEVFGFDLKKASKFIKKGGLDLRVGIGLNYNTYNGFGFDQGVNLAFKASNKQAGHLTAALSMTSSGNGLDIQPELSLSMKLKSMEKRDVMGGIQIGGSFSSRAGLKELTHSTSLSLASKKASKNELLNMGKVIGKRAIGSLIGGGSAISYGGYSYVPNINTSMINRNVHLSIKGGITLFGIEGTGDLAGYMSDQRIREKVSHNPAYGYLYSEVGQQNKDAVMDFNREKDGAFTHNTPALPATNFTHDIYNITGQGISGTIRPFRGEVGYVKDNFASSTSNSATLGAEISATNIYKGGTDVKVVDVDEESGDWSSNNTLGGRLNFNRPMTISSQQSNIPNHLKKEYENVYFKQVGELSVDEDQAMFDMFGKYDPVRPQIAKLSRKQVETTGKMMRRGKNGMTQLSMPSRNERIKRAKRNQVMSYLTVDQAKQWGLEKDLYTSKIFTQAPGHHIGEFTVTKTDGARYVYGLPAYNISQKEVTFNASQRTILKAKGSVKYTEGKDNTTGNKQGIDNYFNSKELPAYPHSWLLTNVVSSDYQDLTGNGPTDDDLGNYTKFSYTRKNPNYKWRTPFDKGEANFNEGVKSDVYDDKGTYVYGQKELWYLNKIETKNYIAVFSIGSRNDGYEVADENGGIGAQSSYLLKKISLYAKPEYNAGPSAAVPIKEVHFEYDYSLCHGIPNFKPPKGNQKGGKLTLTKVYFTYGKSKKAQLSPYKFSYHNNYTYHPKSYNRWGHYKPDNLTLQNSEFPYVDQRDQNNDQYAAAWTLNKIELPSGASIEVDYEADDYAYVEDKRAMQMFRIVAINDGVYSNASDINPKTKETLLMDKSLSHRNHLYVYFKLQKKMPSSYSKKQFFNDYLSSLWGEQVYFKCLTDITDRRDFNYVFGYADWESDGYYGTLKNNSGEHEYGFIKMKKVPIGNKSNGAQVHPFAKAAWQYGRLYTPKLVWDQTSVKSSGIEQVVKSIANSNMTKNIIETIKGPNRTIRDKNYGKKIDLTKSWIRLQNPNMAKVGGGSRVKSIVTNDRWSTNQLGEMDAKTGVEYNYKLKDETEKSSGVAAYEPLIGGEEIPHRLPVPFSSKKTPLIPSDKFYMEEPFGEMFFPSPMVGYSRVEVRNMTPQELGYSEKVTKHGVGHTVHEFYTAKDFPVITKRTDLDVIPQKTRFPWSLFKVDQFEGMTAAQGFSIELNDMHGKPKADWVYGEGEDVLISGQEYYYHTKGRTNQLENDLPVIGKDGKVSKKTIGIEYDIVADFRESEITTRNIGVGLNFTGFMLGFFPIPTIPSLIPSYSKRIVRFRSAAITKVIHKYGILRKTIVHDLGSVAENEDLAYDTETGQVLLNKTANNFHDPVYNFTYPAHWGYEEMGQAYKNLETKLKLDFVSPSGAGAGNCKLTGASAIFSKGDKLAITSGNDRLTGWVLDVQGHQAWVIDQSGNLIVKPGCDVRIIRSGRRNIPFNNIGALQSAKNPIDIDGDGTIDSKIELNGTGSHSLGVLDVQMSTYSSVWKSKEGIPKLGNVTGTNCVAISGYHGGVNPGKKLNPFIHGILGVPRPVANYKYLGERAYNYENNSLSKNRTDVRYDAIYKSYNEFWKPNGGSDWIPTPVNWTTAATVTKYSPFGQELENKNPLNIYSSALFGYNNSLAIAVGQNVRYQDMAYDGFEDYAFAGSSTAHFNFKNSNSGFIRSDVAHSGKYSMLVSDDEIPARVDRLMAPLPPCNATPPVNPTYQYRACDRLPQFSPEAGKEYILSLWVSRTKNNLQPLDKPDLNYDELQVWTKESYTSFGNTVCTPLMRLTAIYESDIIDGWQLRKYRFVLSAGSNGVFSLLLNSGGGKKTNLYVDDVRIYPVGSTMKSFVYDPVNLRHVASLDENNFATFYEYDEEGRLTRVKKETVKGIKTIQENRTNQHLN